MLYQKYKKNIKFIVVSQSLIVIAMCWFGAISLSPGAVSASLRDNVMSRSANGYSLMKWVDKTLPKNAIVLSSHGSISLIPRKTISLDWMGYVKQEDADVSIYLDRIKKEEVTYLLVWGDVLTNNNEYLKFSKCLGDKLYGPEESTIATRNPLNKSFVPFNAWLVEFNSDKLPNCYDSAL